MGTPPAELARLAMLGFFLPPKGALRRANRPPKAHLPLGGWAFPIPSIADAPQRMFSRWAFVMRFALRWVPP